MTQLHGKLRNVLFQSPSLYDERTYLVEHASGIKSEVYLHIPFKAILIN